MDFLKLELQLVVSCCGSAKVEPMSSVRIAGALVTIELCRAGLQGWGLPQFFIPGLFWLDALVQLEHNLILRIHLAGSPLEVLLPLFLCKI